MRLLLFALLSLGLVLPVVAQSQETGEGGDENAPRAQPAGPLGDPGASQDEEAAREKLLKAADQIDLMETNAESIKASMDGMKTQLAQLADDNTALKAQVSTLQDTITRQQDELNKVEAGRAKERQALIDEVSDLMADKPHHAHAVADEGDASPTPKKHDDDAAPAAKKETASLTPPADSSQPVPSSDGPAPASEVASTPVAAPPVTPAATVHPRKGYYHVVAPHETLSLICGAFRDRGVQVTVAQIRHANGLTSKSELKVGQKLFIPKPSA